jgi:ferritin
MLSENLQAAFHKHMTAEFYSAYAYLAMAAHFESEDLPGFAHFFRIHHQEETLHAMKFFDFIAEAGVKPVLGTIEAPKGNFSSPVDAFRDALGHEKEVSASINSLMSMAQEEKAHAAAIFLQWFVSEQVEEEALFSQLVKNLEMLGDSPSGLIMLDRELAGRPAPSSGAAE